MNSTMKYGTNHPPLTSEQSTAREGKGLECSDYVKNDVNMANRVLVHAKEALFRKSNRQEKKTKSKGAQSANFISILLVAGICKRPNIINNLETNEMTSKN